MQQPQKQPVLRGEPKLQHLLDEFFRRYLYR
jgi:hypothetical protein